jgi:transposase
MVNRRIDMRQIRQVLRLAHETDLSQRAIARSLRISRDSVSDYLMRAAALKVSWPLPEEMDDATLEAKLFPSAAAQLMRKPDPDWASVHAQLKGKGATLKALHEEYAQDNPQALKLSQFCHRFRTWQKSLKRYLRQTHVAGERVFVDYAGPTMEIVDVAAGTVRTAQIFVGVLGGSSYTYAEAHWSQKLPDWISAHVRMFEFFGAVPHVIVCDNLKAAVTKASRTQPEINTTYQHLGEHYNSVIIPTRPRKPGDKAKVEGGVLLVERWILFRLRKRRFTSLGELNQAIRLLLDDLNNRPFQKLPGSRRTTFESLDLPAMKSLPSQPFEFVEFRRVRVGPDGRISVDGRPYSVPRVLTRQVIELRLTANVIELLHAGRRVGSMARAPGSEPVVDPDHLTPTERYFATWTPEIELQWAAGLGSSIHAFLAARLAECSHKEQGYRIAGALKKIEREVGSARLDAACKVAIDHGASAVKNIRSILTHGLDALPPAGTVHEAAFAHPNIRGPGYYH